MTDLADQRDRQRALDPNASFIVEAPAGSGKTTLLTQRILALLARVDHPESIVAMTFTVKAAEEMRSRVLSSLLQARDDDQRLEAHTRRLALAALAQSDAKGWRLTENPRRLRIQTIDSLCASLARRGPLNSGFSRDAAMLTDPRTIYQRAARAAIAELGARGAWSKSIRTLLRDLDNDWIRLEQLLIEMLAHREQWLRLVVVDPDRGEFENALRTAVEEELYAAAQMIPQEFAARISETCRYAAGCLSEDKPDDPIVALTDIQGMPAADVSALHLWQAIARILLTANATWRKRLDKNIGFPAGNAEAKAAKAQAVSLIEDLSAVPRLDAALGDIQRIPYPAYTDREWQTIEALFRVLKLAAAHLKVEFEMSNTVDFAEVAQAALLALGDTLQPSELQLLMDYEICHLLIDEFQDTSIAQFELVERLLGGWSEDDGRTVFLVGDPMQSIYRFRQADVGLFIHTIRSAQIAEIPLRPLRLTTNFRAQARLIDWVNETLGCIGGGAQMPFANLPQLHAARPAAESSGIGLHGLTNGNDVDEAIAVVDLVRQLQSSRPEFSIGILVRGRRHLGVINDHLDAAGISVSASEIERLGAQPIVLDLVALSLALLHPADRTAWLALLRAPWCAWPLRVLTDLFEPPSDMTLWQQLQNLSEDDPRLTDAGKQWLNLRQVLAAGIRRIGREPVAGIVEDCWLGLNGPIIYHDANLGHAERFFELLAEYERSETLITATGLADLLERQYVAPPTQAGPVVEIMTIHRAKGLEFDVVIVPGLGRRPRSDSHRLLEWRQYAASVGSRLLFAPIPHVGQTDASIHQFLRDAEKLEAEAEAYRLLYVAITRAREQLHLLGTAQEGADGKMMPPSRSSFLGMLWPALENTMEFTAARSDRVDSAMDAEISTLRRLVTRDLQGRASEDRIALDTPPGIDTDIEFSWASPTAKHIGTITHSLLQRVCESGLIEWDQPRVESLRPSIENRLRGLGVNAPEIPAAARRITTALLQSLKSERGRWLLGGEHEQAASEFALTAVVDGQVQNIVIDRTFVDAAGTRWIVDYKTGEHVGGELDAFIESEVIRYEPQLTRYAQLMRLSEDRPIRLGLYFPLLDEWREWAFDKNGGPE